MTEFVDQLPPGGNRGPHKYAQFYADLKANPGKWAIHPGNLKGSGLTAAQNRLKSRGYEATVRSGVLYVRQPEGDAA